MIGMGRAYILGQWVDFSFSEVLELIFVHVEEVSELLGGLCLWLGGLLLEVEGVDGP